MKNKKWAGRIIAVALTFIIVTQLFAGVAYATDSSYWGGRETGQIESNSILDNAIAYSLRLFANILYFLIFDVADAYTLDTLVYNQNGYGLTLNKGLSEPITRTLLQMYLLFQYLAVILFVPIGLLLTISFVRAGDNAQKKAEFKEKATRVVTTFIWLVCMPEILELLFLVNSLFVSVFYSILQGIGDTDTVMRNGLLLGYMRDLAHSELSTVYSATYLMTIFLNIWTIFYYFIRDITISFLFLIFPLIAIFYPLKKGAVVGWWKEMFSNIITQSIHAFVLSTVVVMAYYSAANMTFTSALYILTAFAMVIPFTSIIKSMLGFEGSVGGARSLAGLGALYGLATFTGMGVRALGAGAGRLKEGVKGSVSALSDKMLLEKKGQEDLSTGIRSVVNRRGELVTDKSIREKARESLRSITRGAVSTSSGIWTGLGTTVGSMAFGNATHALMMGAGATYVGARMGDFAGRTAFNTMAGAAGGVILAKDALQHKSRLEREFGLSAPVLQNTPYQKAEKRALLTERFIKNFGGQELGNLSYSLLSSKNLKDEEIQGIKDATLRIDKDSSVIYGTDKDGTTKILKMGKGDPTLTEPYKVKVSFNKGELALTETRRSDLMSRAEDLAYRDIGREMLSEHAIAAVRGRGYSVDSMEGQQLYERLLGGNCFRDNPLLNRNSEFFDRDLYNRAIGLRDMHYNRLESTELNRMREARQIIGLNRLVFEGNREIDATTENIFDPQHEIVRVAQADISNLHRARVTERIGANYEYPSSGGLPGFALTTKENTTYYVQEGTNEVRVVGYGPGNNRLSVNMKEMRPAQVRQNEIYLGEMKYALEGHGFYNREPSAVEVFTDPELRFGQEIMNRIRPGSQIMATVKVDKESNTGQYIVFDVSSNEYLGTNEIPIKYLSTKDAEAYLQMDGKAIYLQVDQLGNIMVHSEHDLTDVDFNNAISALERADEGLANQLNYIALTHGGEVLRPAIGRWQRQREELRRQREELQAYLERINQEQGFIQNYLSDIQ
jgi:hypothetical protein